MTEGLFFRSPRLPLVSTVPRPSGSQIQTLSSSWAKSLSFPGLSFLRPFVVKRPPDGARVPQRSKRFSNGYTCLNVPAFTSRTKNPKEWAVSVAPRFTLTIFVTRPWTEKTTVSPAGFTAKRL